MNDSLTDKGYNDIIQQQLPHSVSWLRLMGYVVVKANKVFIFTIIILVEIYCHFLNPCKNTCKITFFVYNNQELQIQSKILQLSARHTEQNLKFHPYVTFQLHKGQFS